MVLFAAPHADRRCLLRDDVQAAIAQTQITCSWATMSTEGTTAWKQCRCWWRSKCASATASPSCVATTSRGKSPKCRCRVTCHQCSYGTRMQPLKATTGCWGVQCQVPCAWDTLLIHPACIHASSALQLRVL